MATSKMFIWVTLCTCVVFASPTRRQFNSNTETTSSDPIILVTDDGTSWDDSDDDFDLEGGGWMKEVSASPSSIPESPDYEDYDDEEEDDVVQPDKVEGNNNRDSEFLFLQPTDTRLILEDDDDSQPGIIKVRHTSKNTYSEPQAGNALETIEKSNSNDQFVFTIDGDDDNEDEFEDGSNKVDGSKEDDFVLEDDAEPQKMSKKQDSSSQRENREDDDDDGDDDDEDDVSDNEDDTVFDNPDEDAQVIYGDHVFLY